MTHDSTSTSSTAIDSEEWGPWNAGGSGTEAPVAHMRDSDSLDNWLVVNAADQIVSVGHMLSQQVRTVEYWSPELVADKPAPY